MTDFSDFLDPPKRVPPKRASSKPIEPVQPKPPAGRKAAKRAPVLGPRGGKYANLDQLRMKKIWRSKPWKARTKELCRQFPRCEWCNGISKHVNHKRQGYYEGYELCRREEVDVICGGCHNHFTKTGQRTHKIFDACSSCDARIYQGRKICFKCGGKVIGKTFAELDPARRAALLEVLNICPEVKAGDRWKGIWLWSKQEIEVKDFKPQDELPWPMVDTSAGEVGLPAFIHGVLLERGKGKSWQRGIT